MRAAIWMLGAIASFVAMAVAGREISAELDTFELMFYRSVIGFLIVCFFLSQSPVGFLQLRTRRPGNHIIRNLFHFTGQNLWFYGVAVIPLSQLVALEFTNPLWVALLAPLLLGEPMTRVRAFAAVLGFTGVLIVSRPGVAPLEWGHVAALGAALGFALTTIFTRRIMAHDTVLCVLFWMTLAQGAMGFLLALPGGIPWPSAPILGWVGVTGVTGITAHFSLTSALRYAPASVVAPMEFGRLPVIAIVGMLVYDEPLVFAVFLGACVIIAGNLVNLVAEQRRQKVAA
ncbi:MAG TPA: DMT family transporter [Paracoccaceae bacterium]|nr:DMT family transporter [Paracoccaceae bacterium]